MVFLGDGQTSLAISATDVFVATLWSSVIYIKQVIAQQRRLYATANRRFVYLIQDYESGFLSRLGQKRAREISPTRPG